MCCMCGLRSYHGCDMDRISICRLCFMHRLVRPSTLRTAYFLTDEELTSEKVRNMQIFPPGYYNAIPYVAKKSIHHWFETHFENGIAELEKRKAKHTKECLTFVQEFPDREKRFRQILKQELTDTNEAFETPLLTENKIESITNQQPIPTSWLTGKTKEEEINSLVVKPIISRLQIRQALIERTVKLLNVKDAEEIDRPLWIFVMNHFERNYNARNVTIESLDDTGDVAKRTYDDKIIRHIHNKKLKEIVEDAIKTEFQGKFTTITSLPRISKKKTYDFIRDKEQAIFPYFASKSQKSTAEQRIEEEESILQRSTFAKDTQQFIKSLLKTTETEERLAKEFKAYGFDYDHCHIPLEVERFVNQKSDLTFYQALRELCKSEVLDNNNPAQLIETLNRRQKREAFRKLVEHIYGSVDFVLSDEFLDMDPSSHKSYAASSTMTSLPNADASGDATQTMSAKKKGKQPLKKGKQSLVDESERLRLLEEGKKFGLMELFESVIAKHMTGINNFSFSQVMYRKMIRLQSEEEWKSWESGTTPSQSSIEGSSSQVKPRRGKGKGKAKAKAKPAKKKTKSNTGEAVPVIVLEEEEEKEEDEPKESVSAMNLRRSTRIRARSSSNSSSSSSSRSKKSKK